MFSRLKPRQVGKKVKELSKDLFLTTTDYFASDGVSVARVDFEVEVKKNRTVVFDLSFAGSNNLELDGNTKEKQRNSRRTILEPYSRQIVGSVRVVDMEQRWHLECQYSWTEKESKTKEISPHLHLTTVDNYVRGHKISSIEYILKVNKNKRVIFDIDFTGSSNMELTTGGLKKRVTVEPFQEAEVAFLQVKSSKKPWNIECKYKWFEKNPSQAITGQPEQKEISPGVRLVTTRVGDDEFKYEIVCAKYATVHFTLDLSESNNMSLSNGGLVKHTVIEPWDRAEVGQVRPTDSTKSWSLKIKFEWSESDPQDEDDTNNESGVSVVSPSIRTPMVRKTSIWTPEHGASKINTTATPSARDNSNDITEIPKLDHALVRSRSTPMGPSEEVEESPPKEIAPSLFLCMSTTRSPVRVIYTLDVRKNSRVTFHMNFAGSKNLVLAHGGSKTTTIVEPYAPAVVAVLVVQDAKRDYELSCKYHWEELELVQESNLLQFNNNVSSLQQQVSQNPYSDSSELHARQRQKFPESNHTRTITKETTLPTGQSRKATLSLSEQYHYGSSNGHGSLPVAPPPLAIMQANHHDATLGRRGIVQPETPPPSPPLRRHGGGPVGMSHGIRGGHEQANMSWLPSPVRCPYKCVADFLTSIGLSQYIAGFQDQEVTLELLLDMAVDEHVLRENLKELLVSKIGHREKILVGLRPYVVPRLSPSARTQGNSFVDEEETRVDAHALSSKLHSY